MKINNKINNIVKGLCATLAVLTVVLGIRVQDYLGNEGTYMPSVADVDPDYIKRGADDETNESALLALPVVPFADELNFVYSRKGNGDKTIKLYNATTLREHTYISDLGYLMEYLGVNEQNESYYDVRLQGGMYAIKKEDVSRFLPVSQIKSFPYYENKDGKVVHHVEGQPWNDESWYMTSTLGLAPAWMQSGTKYYSFSGIYFTDSIAKLGQYDDQTNAINKEQPYYDYYLYQPARTKTSLTAQQLDASFNILVGNEATKMTNTGASFIAAQNKYGVNALLMFAMGIHESDYGRSNFAVNRNNLFGVNAVDNDPGNATYFESVEAGIQIQGNDLSWVHADPNEPNGANYYGANLGTKSSGMNVKYASDPYWGEKIANHYARIDRLAGSPDYDKYNIGIAAQGAQVYWDEAGATSAHKYKKSTSGLTYMYPVVYYTAKTMADDELMKITLEPPYKDDRTVGETAAESGIFRWFYGYVHASDVITFNTVQKELPKDEEKKDDERDSKDEKDDSNVNPDPSTPIEPADPSIPSTPLEPAKPTVPSTELDPADPVNPPQQVDPSAPVVKDGSSEEQKNTEQGKQTGTEQQAASVITSTSKQSSEASDTVASNDGNGAEVEANNGTQIEMDVLDANEATRPRMATTRGKLAKSGVQTWEYILFSGLLLLASAVLFAIVYLKVKLHREHEEI